MAFSAPVVLCLCICSFVSFILVSFYHFPLRCFPSLSFLLLCIPTHLSFFVSVCIFPFLCHFYFFHLCICLFFHFSLFFNDILFLVSCIISLLTIICILYCFFVTHMLSFSLSLSVRNLPRGEGDAEATPSDRVQGVAKQKYLERK